MLFPRRDVRNLHIIHMQKNCSYNFHYYEVTAMYNFIFMYIFIGYEAKTSLHQSLQAISVLEHNTWLRW